MKTFKTLILNIFCVTAISLSANTPVTTSTNPCTPQVTIVPIPSAYGCYSLTANNGVPNDPDSYYQWNFEGGLTASGKTVYHCYSPVTTSTSYTLSLTYNSPALCGPLPNVAIYTITLNPPPSTLCVNNTPSITLAASSVTVWSGSAIPEIITSFQYGDGSASTNQPTHTYSVCGNYIITVSQWDMNTPNSICYAYGAVNISCDGPTSLPEIEKADYIRLFPNPATQFITIESDKELQTATVTDVSGKELKSTSVPAGSMLQMDIQELPAGMYFVKLECADKSVLYSKLIKN